MTTGDNYNIACPYCGKINHYPVDTMVKSNGKGNYDFTKSCYHCKKVICYRGQKGSDSHGFPSINLNASKADES